ncbi:MAG TPA: SDR family NAD(P)-dependent oxidoreductase [Saprospiraceae bacterium]|nr:SDR family NAD(P)-dependent oxidoreductase [Saprospiraceae bacterium]
MKKSILLTGASGNLGRIVLTHLSEAGYHMLATASSQQGADALQSEKVDAVMLDLSDEAAVQVYVEEVSAKRDIAAAVLLAGGFMPGKLAETGSAALHRMFAINFETAFYPVRELLPVFEKRGGGQFILIGTRPALEPKEGKNLAAYAFSKGLVFQLAEMINAYGQGKGIDATVIVPSTIDTPANRQAMPDADPSKWVSPEAIADTIEFVLSDSGRQMRKSVLKLYHES